MKTYFDHGAAMEFSNKGPQGAGYTVRIAKEGFSYKSLNGKVNADVKFAEIGALDLTDYCSQNAGYKVRLCDLNMRDMSLPELNIDTIPQHSRVQASPHRLCREQVGSGIPE